MKRTVVSSRKQIQLCVDIYVACHIFSAMDGSNRNMCVTCSCVCRVSSGLVTIRLQNMDWCVLCDYCHTVTHTALMSKGDLNGEAIL